MAASFPTCRHSVTQQDKRQITAAAVFALSPSYPNPQAGRKSWQSGGLAPATRIMWSTGILLLSPSRFQHVCLSSTTSSSLTSPPPLFLPQTLSRATKRVICIAPRSCNRDARRLLPIPGYRRAENLGVSAQPGNWFSLNKGTGSSPRTALVSSWRTRSQGYLVPPRPYPVNRSLPPGFWAAKTVNRAASFTLG